MEEGGQQSQQEQQRRQQMLVQEEYDIEQLQERERSIRQLEVGLIRINLLKNVNKLCLRFQSDILDVNTIFKDLATLVHDQGEIVDSIEANVESTHVRVQEGTEQLRQAETYKVSQWFCLLFCTYFCLRSLFAPHFISDQSSKEEVHPCLHFSCSPWHCHRNYRLASQLKLCFIK